MNNIKKTKKTSRKRKNKLTAQQKRNRSELIKNWTDRIRSDFDHKSINSIQETLENKTNSQKENLRRVKSKIEESISDKQRIFTCKDCLDFKNETCFVTRKQEVCESFRSAPSCRPQHWPNEMQGPYGNLHKKNR